MYDNICLGIGEEDQPAIPPCPCRVPLFLLEVSKPCRGHAWAGAMNPNKPAVLVHGAGVGVDKQHANANHKESAEPLS